MITKDDDDVGELARILMISRKAAEVVLLALPIPNTQGAGHTSFVERVKKGLK